MPVKFATVEEQYKKNKDLKKEDIVFLQEWLKTQIHLPEISEFQIILFHHSCYYDMENTKLCIENYFTLRNKNRNIFTNRDPMLEEIQQAMRTFAVTPMPKKHPLGYTVIYKRLINTDYQNYSCVNHMKLLDMNCSILLHQEGTSPGYAIIIDFKELSLGHFFKLNMFICKAYSQFLQEGLPFRLKEIHLVNGGGLMDRMMSFLKMVMSKHLLELVHNHSDVETLYEYIPKECLPEDIGGYCESTEKTLDFNIKNLEDNRDFFLKEEELLADDTKREKTGNWIQFWK